MMKRALLIFLTLFVATGLSAQNDAIDTTYLKKIKVLNDYSTIGIHYAFGLSNTSIDPVREQKMTPEPFNFGITYTRYGKLFGYMPYFGIQLGVFYTKECLQFQMKEKGDISYYPYYILGAAKREMTVLEVPALAHLHFDFWKMRIMADVGIFGGYRLDIKRSEYVDDSPEMLKYENTFHSKENRFDYGLKAGGGVGLLFDPIEITLTASYKYSWSNLHKPNTNYRYEDSPYYYNWTYPTNIVISLGVHYQITRRVGYTHKELRMQAREEAMQIMEEAKMKIESDEKDNGQGR